MTVNFVTSSAAQVRRTAASGSSRRPAARPVSNSGTNNEYNPQKQVKFDSKGYPVPDGKYLQYVPEESFLLGLITRDAEYIYIANGRESIKDIRAKFHLKDGALRKCNSEIVDANWIPSKGKKIYFEKNDVKVK